MKTNYLFILFCFVLGFTYGQADALQSGPMIGYTTMTETLLWVQTKKAAEVQIRYWKLQDPKAIRSSEIIQTQAKDAFVAHVVLGGLTPDTPYQYEVYLNGQKIDRPYPLQFKTPALWQWRTDPPDFSFALGSCTYINESDYDRPGKPYGAQYQIFESIQKTTPDFMLWLGDNTYLREADWNSRSGILRRFTHTRSTPELQPMLASMPQYATWDDHDYGPDNSDRSFHQKRDTEKAFKLFYPQSTYIFEEGVTSFFQWADCDFFVLDNRYWKTPNDRTDIEHTVLGAAQMNWLLDALSSSKATFKCIVMGGQFLSPVTANERFANIAPEERLALLEKIQQLKIEGVLFFSGDVHYTELTKLPVENGYPLYDLTVSPLTSGPYHKAIPKNPLRVPKTAVQERNFGHICVTGKDQERRLEIAIYNSDGALQWQKNIYAKELTFAP